MLKIGIKSILEGLAPVIKLILNEVIRLVFAEFYAKNPEDAKLVAVSLYPTIDTKLEDVVEKSDTELDDAAVEGIKNGLEAFAQDVGLDLPNIDED